MKWIALLGLLALTPVLAAYLRSNPRHLVYAGFALGLLPFLIARFNLGAAPISWPAWQGISKGIEITVVDAVAVAVLFASTGKFRSPALLKAAVALFMTGLLVSTILSPLKMASSFYVFQFLKCVMIYFAVAKATASVPEFPISVITGAIVGIILNAFAALTDYLGGTMQSGGWLGHQNLLGMASHFIVYPAFALLLAGRYQKRAAVALFAALIIAYAGGSRATIGLMAAGLVLTAVMSAMYRMSARKTGFGVAVVLGLLAASPMLYSAVERRSDEARKSSNEERRKMEEAASMIIADHPLGVGPNRYVVVTNLEGYSARTGVAWNAANRAAPVHNTYYLVAAETGWIGFVGWLAMLGAMIWTAWSTMRRATDQVTGEIAAALTASFLMLSVHMYYEWITMSAHIHYLAAIMMGVLVGLRSRQTGAKAVARLVRPMASAMAPARSPQF